MASPIPLIILSHRRAGKVTTHEYVANTKVCVPEAQADEYAEHHAEEDLIVHPDTVIGGCAKRQWIYEKFGDVFMLDDDSGGMQRLWRPKHGRKRSRCSPKRSYEIIQATAATARRLGAYLFGFGSHAHPANYNPMNPFKFGGYITGGAMGLLKGSKVYFPDSTLPMGDFWACLLNAYFHRYSFIDTRFAFGFRDTYTQFGGTNEFRKAETEAESFRYLKDHFGSAIVKVDEKSPLTKRRRNNGKRMIKLPYNV